MAYGTALEPCSACGDAVISRSGLLAPGDSDPNSDLPHAVVQRHLPSHTARWAPRTQEAHKQLHMLCNPPHVLRVDVVPCHVVQALPRKEAIANRLPFAHWPRGSIWKGWESSRAKGGFVRVRG